MSEGNWGAPGCQTDLAEAQFGSDLVHSCSFGIVHQFQAVLRGILKHEGPDSIKTKSYCKLQTLTHGSKYSDTQTHLRRLVDGSHLSSDAQRDVFVLGEPAVQVSHPLTARLPPEVQEAVGDGVVLKHDVVHVSVFLGGEQTKLRSCHDTRLLFWSKCTDEALVPVCSV